MKLNEGRYGLVEKMSNHEEIVKDVTNEMMKLDDLSTDKVAEAVQMTKLRATGTFCNSLLDDEEDGRPVIMGEGDNEWQCCKLIHRQMWKELMDEEVKDFRHFMKYAYGSEIEEEHFNAETPYCENGDEEKELSILLVLQHSIDRRRREWNNRRGCERQSTWDVPPELFDRSNYRHGWRKVGTAFKDVVTERFEDQWEFIWQNWETNPLTKAAYGEKVKKLRAWKQYRIDKEHVECEDHINKDYKLYRYGLARGDDAPWSNFQTYAMAHVEDCGAMNWACHHARTGLEFWKEKEENEKHLAWYRKNFTPSRDAVPPPPNELFAGNDLVYASEVAREGVIEANDNLERLRQQKEGGGDFGYREALRWDSWKKLNIMYVVLGRGIWKKILLVIVRSVLPKEVVMIIAMMRIVR